MAVVTDWMTRARAAHQQGQIAEASQAYQNRLVEQPDDAEALHGLGVCAIAEGRNQEAATLFERALTLAPDHPAIRRNLGVAYWTLSRRSEAVAALEASDRLEPNNPHTQFNLAVALMGLGEGERARAAYRRCLALDPMHSLAHSNLIFMLDLLADDEEALRERQRFQERHGPPAKAQWTPHANARTTDRRLKIGYVSGDFQFHSASFAFRPVLLNHDRERFEVFCYSATTHLDATSEWYRDEFRWRSLGHLPPNILAEGIRRDGIDILVDLSGHSKDNQLLTFALKPAPVQVTAWGHALGTGLEAIDYLFSDPRVLPVAQRHQFAETVVDLPCVVCFEPQTPAPDVLPRPDRPPTFGAFHRLEKASPVTYDMWSAVLKAVPRSCLIFKCPDFEDPAHRDRARQAFIARGIDPGRLEFRGKTVHFQHLRQMNDVDVMLDTFPHGGGISAIESLWMGVPIITRQGQNLQSRLAASFLALVDLEENVATGMDGYIALAKTQIGATAHLAGLRTSLRDRVLKSPLCQHESYTRAVEHHYQEFWRRWCQ